MGNLAVTALATPNVSIPPSQAITASAKRLSRFEPIMVDSTAVRTEIMKTRQARKSLRRKAPAIEDESKSCSAVIAGKRSIKYELKVNEYKFGKKLMNPVNSSAIPSAPPVTSFQ